MNRLARAPASRDDERVELRGVPDACCVQHRSGGRAHQPVPRREEVKAVWIGPGGLLRDPPGYLKRRDGPGRIEQLEAVEDQKADGSGLGHGLGRYGVNGGNYVICDALRARHI